jgi:hypothetical protein
MEPLKVVANDLCFVGRQRVGRVETQQVLAATHELDQLPAESFQRLGPTIHEILLDSVNGAAE